MRSRFTAKLCALLAITLVSLQSAYAADLAQGERLSQTCLGCHGAPGLRNASPVYRVPMIGGQHAEYIVLALQAYKKKERSHPTMQAQAGSLSDQDMQDIGAYFASLSASNKPLTKSGAAAGKEKAAVCAGCHGIDGNTDNPIYPKLAGQYDDYLERALLDYKSGARNNAIMQGFATQLSKQDIRELSRWFRSQKGDINAPVIKVKK